MFLLFQDFAWRPSRVIRLTTHDAGSRTPVVETHHPAPSRERGVIPKIDQDPLLVAGAETWQGRIVIVMLATALAVAFKLLDVDLVAAPIAAVSAYAQKLRRYVIPLGTLAIAIRHGFWVDVATIREIIGQEGVSISLAWLYPGMLVPIFAVMVGLLAVWPRLAFISLCRRPTVCLIAGMVALLFAAQSPLAAGAPRIILWSLLLTAQPYLWFMAYALADGERRPGWQHLGVFHPFWGSSMTPFGKGLAYLSRYDARTPQDLAITQLKGLKLALWTLILAVCLRGFLVLIHGSLSVPPFDRVFLDYVGGRHDPRLVCWASLASFYIEDVLTMTVWGGAIVACARLAGFRLLRNTYRPLEARSLAEFWNRYYFYYKELLVDHFFYPVFFRCFRRHRKLRIFFATFMAACVGNLLFHFLRDIRFIAEIGFWKAISGEASHAFYTFLLAIGVGLSQARGRSPNADHGWLRGRAVPFVWVALFFCVLHVFDAPLDRIHTIGQRASFLTYLLGLDTWT